MELRCLAIDDEPLALRKVATFLARIPGATLVKTFDNALDALLFLKEETVDMIFLDIQMEAFTGIQFLETVTHPPQIILTTAFEQFALKGFDFHVTDYLLKPYSFERFVQAVDRAMENLARKPAQTADQERDFFFVKTEYRLEKVFPDEILYVEGMRDYLQIVTRTKKILTLQHFAFLESKLRPPRFFRVHKSFLIPVAAIESIERGGVRIHGRVIPVSHTYREEFFRAIAGKMP